MVRTHRHGGGGQLYFFGKGIVPTMATNIYVGNLSYQSTDQDLRGLFEQYGEVYSAKVIEDRETGRSRGFGFVEMDSEGGQSAIAALNGRELAGRALKVNQAQPREARPSQRW
jgi:RNA recognition motif-containing protein